MNSKFYTYPVRLLAPLLLLGQSAFAIKIVVPDQYKDQVEEIKQAELQERERELQGSASSTGSEGIQIAAQAEPEDVAAPAADEFLMQSVVEATATAAEYEGTLEADQGLVSGQIVDKESGEPLSGVAILIEGADMATVTAEDGRYSIGPVAAGAYTLSFIKSGYIEANVTDYSIAGGEVSVFPFALPPRPAEMSDEVYELQDFTVTAEEANNLMLQLELRMNSDKMLDLFSSEDFSKFASSNVADALKRVAGVNVVDGQFAIIRGLEDRYSSTTYNGAPVPSPDPDSQSVQLDLFPSDIVSNLEIAKTYAADLPSNSSGGSINIFTNDYPDEPLQIKVKAGTGFEENATDRFLKLERGNAIGEEVSSSDVIESDFSVFVGGRREFQEREVRFKFLAANEIDYGTDVGVYEARAANPYYSSSFAFWPSHDGDLAAGELNQTGGSWEQTKSTREEQSTFYFGVGLDLDRAGKHKLDVAVFHTNKTEETIQYRENGYIPDTLSGSYWDAVLGTLDFEADDINTARGRNGPAVSIPGTWLVDDVRSDTSDTEQEGDQGFYAPVFESLSQYKERELTVAQVNGEHELWESQGLSLTWAANQASTTELEETYRMKYYYDFTDDSGNIDAGLLTAAGDPTTALEVLTVDEMNELKGALNDAAGDANAYETAYTADAVYYSKVEVEEAQDFGRIDLHWAPDELGGVELKADLGGYYEHAERTVDAEYLESASFGSGENLYDYTGGSASELSDEVYDNLSGTIRMAESESERDVQAAYLKGSATVGQFEFLGGVRLESLSLLSDNDPFFTESNGDWKSFPNFTVLEDVMGVDDGTYVDLDQGVTAIPGMEDEIAEVVDGDIDEDLVLPSLGFVYRPIEGMNIRFAWSKTVARPSFREMGYYATVQSGTGNLVVGNPSLGLSDVQSYDARVEYTWGRGDLVAFSVFMKEIDDPIEKYTFRDRQNFDSVVMYESYFNNETTADLTGIEFEFQKSLDFLEADFLQYFSFGGNFTYISAEVDRSDREMEGTDLFFGADGEGALEDTRSLYGQPEWIANLNLTFEQPDWGTRVTLAAYAISDILDSAGSVSYDASGDAYSYTPDLYVGSYYQLDLVIKQQWRDWTFGITVKNLTDSLRTMKYDSSVLSSTINEYEYRVGRDYSISASYTF